jgi:hypothetical protein
MNALGPLVAVVIMSGLLFAALGLVAPLLGVK